MKRVGWHFTDLKRNVELTEPDFRARTIVVLLLFVFCVWGGFFVGFLFLFVCVCVCVCARARMCVFDVCFLFVYVFVLFCFGGFMLLVCARMLVCLLFVTY